MTTLDAPALASAPLLDASVVATLRDLMLLGRLYPAFMTALPGQLASLQAAVAAGDRPTLRLLAHRLRGSSGQLGATALSRAFGALEDAIAEDDGRPWPSGAELDALAAATTAAMIAATRSTPDR